MREEISVEELKKGDRVGVKVEPMFIFLTRGGMCRTSFMWNLLV